MDQQDSGAGNGTAPGAPRLASRRQWLRRSLGTAAPVVLTLGSAPVSAGMCVTASGFVSATTFASRVPYGAQTCSGLSPSEWARSTYWPAGASPTLLFRNALGSTPLSPRLNENATLADVLAQPTTVEAHIAAVYLNALKGTTAIPLENDQAVRVVWHNIRTNLGVYQPESQTQPLTEQGTLDWLALTWQ